MTHYYFFIIIFSNAGAIKACMNLAMVGCNDEILTAVRKYAQEDEVLGSLSCDILPDLPSTYKAPGIMLPVECLNSNITGNLKCSDWCMSSKVAGMI